MQACKNTSSAQSDTRDLGGKENQPGAAKAESTNGWIQQVMGEWDLIGCALRWGGASWLESSPAPSWSITALTTFLITIEGESQRSERTELADIFAHRSWESYKKRGQEIHSIFSQDSFERHGCLVDRLGCHQNNKTELPAARADDIHLWIFSPVSLER